jgi:1-acyl-sn-glycerol-3-phosphate acyltransferase
MGLIGTHELLPMHSVHVRPRRVRVVIGDPIPTADLHIKQRDDLTARLRNEISRLIAYT